MKMKKLSEDHYIVVDDSEIKEGDWYLTFQNNEVIGEPRKCEDSSYNFIYCRKITHSTQPLGFLNEHGFTTANLKPDWTNVEYLPLSEVKELLGEVDVEKKGEKKYPKSEFWVGSNPSRLYDENAKERRAYIEGYREALEDNKEKKYTYYDIENAFNSGRGYGVPDDIKDFDSFIQSIQPTEWEVEFVNGKLKS